jgi:putative methanogenesis marker 16 metalloprotein
MQKRSLEDIRTLLKNGQARVLTAQEVAALVEEGCPPTFDDVDVVTTGTRGVMSGTYASLSFPVSGATFKKAQSVTLNGVPAFVGPCPNENLGVLDLIVFGTARSLSDPRYGGGHLFRDMAAGKPIEIKVTPESETAEGCHGNGSRGQDGISDEIYLEDIPIAKLFASRNAFKNYSAFVNPGDTAVRTIFHALAFPPGAGECTFSGCGEISPLKCDPLLETIGVGTRILMNGSEGYVIGSGTRSSRPRPNLSGFADMHAMSWRYLGGFQTSHGPECINAWAIPIPVISYSVLDAILTIDRHIPLPVMDVSTRKQIAETNYGRVWDDVDYQISARPKRCAGCPTCKASEACPMGAIGYEKGSPTIDREVCFNCGLCTTTCDKGVFRARLGYIALDDGDVPVVLRQSDRSRAVKLADDLKRRILDGSFKLTDMLEQIS